NCSKYLPLQCEINQTFSPFVPGNYAVVVSNSTFCTNDTSVCYTFATTGTKTVLNKEMIYPNPFKDEVFVSIYNDFQSIQLVDIQGRVLLTKLNASKHNLVVLNTESFANGLYFIRIKYNDNNSSTYKIIKN
ncbi:MAG: T9SS type A sorting domain-containing protein, partial [Bacteroidota bacterium]|nr:T9SS type A sorting domain-containing protein [Bacteroidota bacterium]